MNDLALAVRQLRYENKSFWRNPPAAGFTLVFPLLLLGLSSLFAGFTVTLSGRDVPAPVVYVPVLIALSVITSCYTNIAMTVAIARERGSLKRISGTPLPPWAYLFGRIAHATLIALLLVIAVLVVGVVLFGAPLPYLPGLIATAAVGAATFCALGLAVTCVIPDAHAAPAIVNVTILPLIFVSLIPPDIAPQWLEALADVFPVEHFADALVATFAPFGSAISVADLAVLAAWGIAATMVASSYFSWEPRR